MAKTQITLRWMTGEGLSPGEENDYMLANDHEIVVTHITQVSQGNFHFVQQREESKVPDGVLAKLTKHSSNLSIILEPLVGGVSIELPPSSRSARLFDSDRICIPPSTLSQRHFIHLRPDDTINFQHQGLKVAIMAEIPNSTSESSPSSNVVETDAVNETNVANRHAEVQVKSSHVEPESMTGEDEDGDEDESTDSSEDDLDQPSTERSARTPTAAHVTPATSRPTEPTVRETPKERGAATEEDNEPYSTAPDVLDEDVEPTTNDDMEEDAVPPISDTESPSVKAQTSVTARRAAKDSHVADSNSDESVNNTPASEPNDDLRDAPPKLTRTYGKQSSRRTTPSTSTKPHRTTIPPEGLGQEDESAFDGELLNVHDPYMQDEGDPGPDHNPESPGIPATSEADERNITLAVAARSLSNGSAKRKAAKEVEEEDRESSEPPVAKKRKTKGSPAKDDYAYADAENEDAPADKINGRAKRGRTSKSIQSAIQEDGEEIAVAPQKPSKLSPQVVIQVPRASKRMSQASDTPSGSAASSALAGKIPSILLSRDSALRKSCGKWLIDRGATIIDDPKTKRTNYVCVVKDDKVRTVKVLRSLAQGKLVVTEDWVTQSKKAGHLLEPDDFIHKELQETIHLDRHNIFQGKNLFFTKTLVEKVYMDGWDDIKALVEDAGASHVEKGDSGSFGKIIGSMKTICFGHGELDLEDEEFILRRNG